jgi:hypothetical protein
MLFKKFPSVKISGILNQIKRTGNHPGPFSFLKQIFKAYKQ